MARNTYYKSPHWLSLRQSALIRDKHTCAVLGCHVKATRVDHITTRPNSSNPTPADRLSNLRSLCALHDNQTKEDAQGKRRSGGQFKVIGCDAQGSPIDPSHPWNRL